MIPVQRIRIPRRRSIVDIHTHADVGRAVHAHAARRVAREGERTCRAPITRHDAVSVIYASLREITAGAVVVGAMV